MRNPVEWVRGFFADVDELDAEVEAKAAELEAQRVERLCRSPFMFADEDDWRAFRRRHGRRRPR